MAWIDLIKSHLSERAVSLFSQLTAAPAAPADANPPPTKFALIGDGTTDQDGDTVVEAAAAILVAGWRQVSLTIELFVSSGSGTATFRPYFWDGSRWVKCGDVITFTSTQTSSIPAARERHDILVEHDYGFALVLESISGTGAKASAWATRKDSILAKR